MCIYLRNNHIKSINLITVNKLNILNFVAIIFLSTFHNKQYIYEQIHAVQRLCSESATCNL